MSWEEAVVPERVHRAQPSAGCKGHPLAAASLPYLMTISSHRVRDRMVVVLRGAFDHVAGEELERSLINALESSVQGIDLDLKEVSFWDCATLNVLLAVRQLALRHGKTVTLRATSPIVERVLELTDTLPLFTAHAKC
ncbi:STAS domain-containing protein [Streptomyces sp. TP-A0356]|uniref:STAS domain-containing protein n=1 Tax=Streptomyces sp. TP-A0356 TaxID=1359208 RepID=UPI000A891F30|nr:STAS domain-containing protein [Streptomyces sp. TP-A0356]